MDRPGLVLSLLLAATSTGCATTAMQGVFWRNAEPPVMLPDAWHDVHVYAGTALHAGILGWVCGAWDFPPGQGDPQHIAWTMLLFDLPFSLVGDTVLLPMTLCQQAGIIPRPARRER